MDKNKKDIEEDKSLSSSSETEKQQDSTPKFKTRLKKILIGSGATLVASAIIGVVAWIDLSDGVYSVTGKKVKNFEPKESTQVNDTEDTEPKLNMKAKIDPIPKIRVKDTSQKAPFKNSLGYYLVDTDGDYIGDEYWGITKEDLDTKSQGTFLPIQLDNDDSISFLLPIQYWDGTHGKVVDLEDE